MRKKMTVSRMALARVVEGLEDSETFDTRDKLYQAIANTEWARTHKPKPITKSIAMLRIEEFGIPIKTQKGRRGLQLLTDEQKNAIVSGKRTKKSIDISEIRVPQIYTNLLKRVATGSLVAAIKLKCLECCNYQKEEIKYCTCKGCPLWGHRPYKTSKTAIDKVTEPC